MILGEQGVLKGLKRGGIMVDMTTSQPSLAKEIADEAKKVGVASLGSLRPHCICCEFMRCCVHRCAGFWRRYRREGSAPVDYGWRVSSLTRLCLLTQSFRLPKTHSV